MTETASSQPAASHRSPETVARSQLGTALRRARWTIFWERLWPALARLAAVVGLFLTVSWLGLWLWLPPLARAAGLAAFAVLALAAIVPFVSLRLPAAADALRRLDRRSGVRHRPATTITDELAVTPQDPYSLALWQAHVERTLAAARAFKAGWPSPRLSLRDPYALRGLVLIAVIATFIAAGGEHWKRVAAAFDWQGVVLPANFRVDTWVTPPAYTGKPPIILAGMHPGEVARQDADASEPVSVPAGSTLVVRATGKLNLDISGKGGVTPATEKVQAPAGTQEYRFKIATTGAATLRGAGDDLTWAFNVIPDRPPTISLAKDPEQQARGSILLSYRLEDDYGVIEARATFARKEEPETQGAAAHPLFGPPDFALVLPQARTKSGIGQTIKDLTDHPWAGAEVTMTLVARDEAGNEGKSESSTFRLPERAFTKPLARALVEQRRNLALDAGGSPAGHHRDRRFGAGAGAFHARPRDLSRAPLDLLVAHSRQHRRRFARSDQAAVADGGRHRGRRHLRRAGQSAQRRGSAAPGARTRRHRSGNQAAHGSAAVRRWTASCSRCRSNCGTISSSRGRSTAMRGP